jgi:hypothetical protein
MSLHHKRQIDSEHSIISLSACEITVDANTHEMSFVPTLTNGTEFGAMVHISTYPIVNDTVADSPIKQTDQFFGPRMSMKIGVNKTMSLTPNDQLWNDLLMNKGRVGFKVTAEYPDTTVKTRYVATITTDRTSNVPCNVDTRIETITN